jgi:hypothetical protein
MDDIPSSIYVQPFSGVWSNWSSLQKVEWHNQNLVELYGYKIT